LKGEAEKVAQIATGSGMYRRYRECELAFSRGSCVLCVLKRATPVHASPKRKRSAGVSTQQSRASQKVGTRQPEKVREHRRQQCLLQVFTGDRPRQQPGNTCFHSEGRRCRREQRPAGVVRPAAVARSGRPLAARSRCFLPERRPSALKRPAAILPALPESIQKGRPSRLGGLRHRFLPFLSSIAFLRERRAIQTVRQQQRKVPARHLLTGAGRYAAGTQYSCLFLPSSIRRDSMPPGQKRPPPAPQSPANA